MENESFELKSIKLELEPGIHYWCSCPDNHTDVIVDKTHIACDPLEFEITEKRPRSYCTCKQTLTPPFCDASHKAINERNALLRKKE